MKRLIGEFDPVRNPTPVDIPLRTIIDVVEDDGGKNTYDLSADTRSKSKRDILIEGLTIVKGRMDLSDEMQAQGEPIEINGKPMKPAVMSCNTDGTNWVDPLIRQWTGGFRDGILICWDLNDGYRYKYNIFEHKLTRVARDS